MEQEIIEGNKLIAKFMGARGYYLNEDIITYPAGDNPEPSINNGTATHNIYDLKYHSSWDWLMPVMEKIGQEYNVRITWCADGGTKGLDVTYIDRPDVFDKSIADFGGYGAIVNTWKCAVKFIEWHNYKFRKTKQQQ